MFGVLGLGERRTGAGFTDRNRNKQRTFSWEFASLHPNAVSWWAFSLLRPEASDHTDPEREQLEIAPGEISEEALRPRPGGLYSLRALTTGASGGNQSAPGQWEPN